MAGPFGITDVNIPGLLGMHQEMKARRLEEMYNARKIAQEDKEIEREDRKEAALAKVFAKGGDPASSGGGSAPQTLPPLGQPLPPRTDGVTINQGALQDLFAIDPQGAAQIQKFVYDSDEARLKQAVGRGEAMAQVATALGSVPPDARQAAFQQWAPFLQERGFTPEMLQQADLSDAGLNRYYTQGRTIEQIISGQRDTRDATERARHNQVIEGNSAANIDLRRQALDLARRREGRVASGAEGVSELSDQALIDMALGR